MGDWDAHPKIKNFPNLMIFDQKAWTKAHENDQNLCILKKNIFEKFENWMAFDQNLLTITPETAKYDEKNIKLSQKVLCCCRAIVHACLSSLQCGKKKNCLSWKRKKQNHAQSALQSQ